MGGPLARVSDGDWIELDAVAGTVCVEVSDSEMDQRETAVASVSADLGVGREFFGVFRQAVGSAEDGASVLYPSAHSLGQTAMSQATPASKEAVA